MNEHTRSGKAIRVTVEEAEARIAELLRRAEAGERVEVVRDGKPVVELAAAEEAPARCSIRGAMKDEIWIAPDFDDLGPEWDEYLS
ncbi:type II toxin-antitoxin system Phd/YefM family antitoxin [Aquibium oceanicum]